MQKKTITVAAVVIQNSVGQVLHVRKVGTSMLMLPGGKPEADETMLACAKREILEEIGLKLAAENLHELGTFTTRAANESDFILIASVFRYAVRLDTLPVAHAEIAEVCWIDPHQTTSNIAPLNLEHIFPLLLQHTS